MKTFKNITTPLIFILICILYIAHKASQGDIVSIIILVFFAIMIVMVLTASIILIGIRQSAKITQTNFEKNALENINMLKSIQGVMGNQLNGLSKLNQIGPSSGVAIDNDVFEEFDV